MQQSMLCSARAACMSTAQGCVVCARWWAVQLAAYKTLRLTRLAEEHEALVAGVPQRRPEQQLRGVNEGRGAPRRLQTAPCHSQCEP